jgi:hypothetical protein
MKYYLLLSCENISVNNEKIERLISKMIESGTHSGNNGSGIKIECTCKHSYDIKRLINYLRGREKSTVYVIDAHKELDNINYWEIGYAMGKGIEIIGYSDGESEKKIPTDLENVLNISEDTNLFVENIIDILNNLEPKVDIFSEDWHDQLNSAKKEYKEGI